MTRLFAVVCLALVATPAVAQQPCELVATKAGGYTLVCTPPPQEAHPRLFQAAVIGVGGFMFADAMQTAYTIGAGKSKELNPILAPFAQRPAAFGLVKGTLDTFSLVAVLKLHEHPRARKTALIVLALQAAMSAATVVNNQHVLRAGAP